MNNSIYNLQEHYKFNRFGKIKTAGDRTLVDTFSCIELLAKYKIKKNTVETPEKPKLVDPA